MAPNFTNPLRLNFDIDSMVLSPSQVVASSLHYSRIASSIHPTSAAMNVAPWSHICAKNGRGQADATRDCMGGDVQNRSPRRIADRRNPDAGLVRLSYTMDTAGPMLVLWRFK